MSEVCKCGHGKAQHVYEYGACRPGFRCQDVCNMYRAQETRDTNDRHPKWVPVEPGHVIPAGQPWRQEREDTHPHADKAIEYVSDHDVTVGRGVGDLFVDSSWKPPLVLPTEPTWGIAVNFMRREFGQWSLEGDNLTLLSSTSRPKTYMVARTVTDFIPLTPEQVARIERTNHHE